MARLTADERECILRTSDADDGWHVYATRSSKMGRRLLKLAIQIGVSVEEMGRDGVRFVLPLNAVSFRRPRNASPAQREHLARVRLAARSKEAAAHVSR